MNAEKYWEECIAEAASECNLKLTDEQLIFLAGSAQGAHENYGTAFYHPESPYPAEIKELKRQLAEERSKVACPACKGKCIEVIPGPYHSSVSQCPKCRGEGKVLYGA